MSKLRLVGEELRDEGIARVAAHNEEWLDWIRRVAMDASRLHGSVTSDDLRAWAEFKGRRPDHPNAWGAVFREKGWTRLGYQQSERPEARCRPIGVWKWEGP
ncbi:MAG: hypothetical protein KJN60_11715 [Boseongicola sp.]|nr:hypothetical protein [Boseongicola sp.]